MGPPLNSPHSKRPRALHFFLLLRFLYPIINLLWLLRPDLPHFRPSLLKPPPPPVQPICFQPLRHLLQLFFLERYFMCSSLFGPKIGYGEAGFEVGAEVPHPSYGEHNVHAKLCVTCQ